MSVLSKCDNLLEIDIQVSPVRPKYKTAHNTKCQARRGSYRSVNSVGGRDEEGELHDRTAVPGSSAMPVVSSALLAAALSLFLILIGVVVVKYVRYRWRVHSDSDDGSDDDNEEEDREAAVGVNMNGEKIALIAQEQRRMQRAEQQPSDGGVFSRLWALLSLPGAVVETKLLPKKYRKRKAKCAPKKFHKPYFYPLLEETAQWWEAQCQLQTIKVDSTSPVLSAPLVPSPPAPSSTIKRVAIAPEHHLSYSRQTSTNCELFYAADAMSVLSN